MSVSSVTAGIVKRFISFWGIGFYLLETHIFALILFFGKPGLPSLADQKVFRLRPVPGFKLENDGGLVFNS